MKKSPSEKDIIALLLFCFEHIAEEQAGEMPGEFRWVPPKEIEKAYFKLKEFHHGIKGGKRSKIF